MKKFKLISSVVAIVFILGIATSAFAATFSTNTSYGTDGNATVTTTVSGLVEGDVGAQITYIAYKQNTIDSDNILYVNQEEVTASNYTDFKFRYTVAKEDLSGVSVTAIGLGTDSVDSLAAGTAADAKIGAYTVSVASGIENGSLSLSASEAYPDAKVTVTITPDKYYELDEFFVGSTETPVVGNTIEVAITADTVVSATFKELEVSITPELSLDERTQFADIDTVEVAEYTTVDKEVVDVTDGSGIPVKNVLGKVIGNPAGYEYGMKVTLSDDEVLYYKAYDINEDGTFAVRLIDVSDEKNAFDGIETVETYLTDLAS